jgi:hypothetical protein
MRERYPTEELRTWSQKIRSIFGSGFISWGIVCNALDQAAFNRNRLWAEKLIGSRVLEQLIRVPSDSGSSNNQRGYCRREQECGRVQAFRRASR